MSYELKNKRNTWITNTNNHSGNSERKYDNTRLAAEICEYYDNNEDLEEFFNKVLSYTEKENEINRLNLCNQIQNDCHKLYTLINNLDKMKVKIGKSVKITGSGNDRTCILIENAPVPTDEGKGFGGVGHYIPNYATYFGMEFDGIFLNKEILKKDGNPFLDRYKNWQDKNFDIEERIDEEAKKIKREENNIFAIFNKKSHEEKLEQNRINLGRLQSELVLGINMKEEADKYDKLSDKIKRDIIIYLTMVMDSSKIDMDIKNNMEKVNSGSYIVKTILPEQLSLAVKKAYDAGVITDDDINNTLDVIKSKEVLDYKAFVKVFVELFERYATNTVEEEKGKIKIKKDN
ncbi:MAG: hypothetical protein IKN87_05220 [Bacilli bacterium]|nr:hypothetical protein [Bacilli bacterium]